MILQIAMAALTSAAILGGGATNLDCDNCAFTSGWEIGAADGLDNARCFDITVIMGNNNSGRVAAGECYSPEEGACWPNLNKRCLGGGGFLLTPKAGADPCCSLNAIEIDVLYCAKSLGTPPTQGCISKPATTSTGPSGISVVESYDMSCAVEIEALFSIKECGAAVGAPIARFKAKCDVCPAPTGD